ncbi:MAG: hypothetical protein D6828_06195, partial [Nitrospirae bacterium]
NTFREDTAFMLKNIPHLLKTFLSKRINKSFIHKIMLAVSAVNGCSYCSWLHAKLALLMGEMDIREIENILKTEIGEDVNDYEVMGLAYAQHYAVTDRRPDPEAKELFYEFYGKEIADHITRYIEAINYANKAGNTFEAFLNRFKGNPAPNSSLLFEALFFLFTAPFFIPLMPFVKKKMG